MLFLLTYFREVNMRSRKISNENARKLAYYFTFVACKDELFDFIQNEKQHMVKMYKKYLKPYFDVCANQRVSYHNQIDRLNEQTKSVYQEAMGYEPGTSYGDSTLYCFMQKELDYLDEMELPLDNERMKQILPWEFVDCLTSEDLFGKQVIDGEVHTREMRDAQFDIEVSKLDGTYQDSHTVTLNLAYLKNYYEDEVDHFHITFDYNSRGLKLNESTYADFFADHNAYKEALRELRRKIVDLHEELTNNFLACKSTKKILEVYPETTELIGRLYKETIITDDDMPVHPLSNILVKHFPLCLTDKGETNGQ